jgi:EmrB/QacA subfamily drug resistance transporter
LVLFALASAMCGFAGGLEPLIMARIVQGIPGGMLPVVCITIVMRLVPPEKLGAAMGIYGLGVTAAPGAGPMLGGYLVEYVDWRLVFFLNVPIGILGFIVGLRTIRESRSEQARHLDIPGLLLGTAALFSLTYALIEVNQYGWSSPSIVTALIAAVVFFVSFLRYEHRALEPMMPLHFFRIPAFSAGNSVAFSISLGMFGTFFFMSLYFQSILHYGPFAAGLRFLPLTGMIVIAAPLAGRYASKFGSRLPMTVGPLLAGGGLLLLSRVGLHTPFSLIFPVFMMMGLGMGMTMTPMTAAVMNAVGPQRAGMGSAMTNTSREVGGVFGIALLGTLLTTKLKGTFSTLLGALGLPAAQKAAIVASGGHGAIDPRALAGLGPQKIAGVYHAFGLAFVDGFHVALMVAAFFLIGAAIVSWRFIPHGAPQRETVPGAEPVAVH